MSWEARCATPRDTGHHAHTSDQQQPRSSTRPRTSHTPRAAQVPIQGPASTLAAQSGSAQPGWHTGRDAATSTPTTRHTLVSKWLSRVAPEASLSMCPPSRDSEPSTSPKSKPFFKVPYLFWKLSVNLKPFSSSLLIPLAALSPQPDTKQQRRKPVTAGAPACRTSRLPPPRSSGSERERSPHSAVHCTPNAPPTLPFNHVPPRR